MAENKKMGLPAKMGIGLIAGVIAGLIFQKAGWNVDYVKPVGDLFIRLIRMVVIPLVFASLVAGAASIGDSRKLGSIASKSIAWMFGTTAVAVGLGLFFANLIKPGVGLSLSTEGLKAKEIVPPSIVDTLLNIVPINPLQAFAEGNLLQVIFFAVFFGFALNAIGERGKPLLNIFEMVTDVMIKLTGIVMNFAPYGVFALITFTVAKNGAAVLLPLIKLIVAMYLVSVIHIILVYLLPIKFIAGKSWREYFKAIAEPLLVAFSTCSSAAALALNLKSTQKLGASKNVASFTIPLGNTINMDGAAIYLGLAAVFVAQVYNIPLTGGEQLTILLMAVLASIGSVGVPSMALVVMTMVFTSIGLPLEGIALVAGVDRILDMARTSLNVFGDNTTALIVSKWEGELGETNLELDEQAT
ncbi:sodium:dicarboxylate symporter [Desulforamulus reducens MI-1]|uniref:Sodium:dicarboxylate symporter n=1 Tax=Desulforamulus reducens (strain ATCC BAA-1160 / DSM 100696 / MI-1) TaxID=349161 RepID=A4J253_DESRM|nr:dicarboxylate/amino acid:cation symporter [Desulforamulus reducens]ABO49156.1 sodium:dicarboxylate symporter [Desulforamulus reducens MI-1]